MLLIVGYDGYLFMFILCTAQAYAGAAISHLVMQHVFQPANCVSSRLYWLSRDPGTACARAGLS